MGDFDYSILAPWFSISKASFAIAFGNPWTGLDPKNLNSILQKGKDTVAVQYNPDKTASIFIAPSELYYAHIFHMHSSTNICEYFGSNSGKPWSKTVKAEPEDFIMVLNDTDQGEQIAKWVTECAQWIARGTVVPRAEYICFLLSCFVVFQADTIFYITSSDSQ